MSQLKDLVVFGKGLSDEGEHLREFVKEGQARERAELPFKTSSFSYRALLQSSHRLRWSLVIAVIRFPQGHTF